MTDDATTYTDLLSRFLSGVPENATTESVRAFINTVVSDRGILIINANTDAQSVPVHDGSNEIVIDFGTISDGNLSMLNGVITNDVAITGLGLFYEIDITQVGGGQPAEMTIWAEINTGGGFAPLANSLRQYSISKDVTSVISGQANGVGLSAAGNAIRMMAANTGSGTLEIVAPSPLSVATGTATGFAKSIEIGYRLDID